MSSPYTDNNRPCGRCTNRFSQVGAFPTHFRVEPFRTIFPQQSSKGVSVEIPFRRNERFFNTRPCFWPFVTRQTYGNIRTFGLGKFQQCRSILPPFPVPLLLLFYDGRLDMMWRPFSAARRLCLPIRSTVPRISSHVRPFRRTTQQRFHQILRNKQLFSRSCKDSRSEHFCTRRRDLCSVYIRVSASQPLLIKKSRSLLQINVSSIYFSWVPDCVFSHPF